MRANRSRAGPSIFKPDENIPSWNVIRISLLVLLIVQPERLKSVGSNLLIASSPLSTGGIDEIETGAVGALSLARVAVTEGGVV